MPDKKIALNITSAVAIDGKIITPSSDEAKGVMVDESLAKNLLQRGRAELATAGGTDAKPLAKMSVPELKAEAIALDVDGVSGMNKSQLIEAIEEALSE